MKISSLSVLLLFCGLLLLLPAGLLVAGEGLRPVETAYTGEDALDAIGGEAAEDRAAALLQYQAHLIWQRINEARSRPRQVLERLALDEARVRAALGHDAWILDYGLPPLALDERIMAAARFHANEMLAWRFYGHRSPAGYLPDDRVRGAGYHEALEVGETLAALATDRFLPLDLAVVTMLDNMMRDELTGAPGVERNIFSPLHRELGLSFLAESTALFAGRPHTYLLVADFTRPWWPRSFMIGRLDPGHQALLVDHHGGDRVLLPVLPAGGVQFPVPAREFSVIVLDANGLELWRTERQEVTEAKNHLLDLRLPVE